MCVSFSRTTYIFTLDSIYFPDKLAALIIEESLFVFCTRRVQHALQLLFISVPKILNQITPFEGWCYQQIKVSNFPNSQNTKQALSFAYCYLSALFILEERLYRLKDIPKVWWVSEPHSFDAFLCIQSNLLHQTQLTWYRVLSCTNHIPILPGLNPFSNQIILRKYIPKLMSKKWFFAPSKQLYQWSANGCWFSDRLENIKDL